MVTNEIYGHAEWLSLVEVSGPFLAMPVLETAFPQGLESVETPRRQLLRRAYEEWHEALDNDDRLLQDIHREWVTLVLSEILEMDGTLRSDSETKANTYFAPDRSGSYNPTYTLQTDSDTNPSLFVSVYPPETDLDKPSVVDTWSASLLERMIAACRFFNVRLGLMTNGERWTLVNAPVGSTSGHTSWYARFWFQEPNTLRAFQSLLGIRRFFGHEEGRLPTLLDASLEHHEEITDTLGEQVRRAVEVLIQCVDKADQDRDRALLRDVTPSELYEAGLTIMMRTVFVLCAEERRLLPLGEPIYDQNYAIYTLRGLLAEEADRHGPEVLERRHDAWARLLATFRVVYAGIENEALRLPALDGSLFDPDRFPFLEGRAKDTTWRDVNADPLPIDNRTVLLLLDALQVLKRRGGALVLSYKALNVEQIGHVYEGLLEYTAKRMPTVTLGFQGSGKVKRPDISLAELESAQRTENDNLVKFIVSTTKRSVSAIKNALSKTVKDHRFPKLVSACGGDAQLADRIHPFIDLLRKDAWGEVIFYPAGSFAVTLGADRRETGTHYTPKSLTETIVEKTLEPVAYRGPSKGLPREQWSLKSSEALLDLKICDPAMGSGAFLVQVCRWLGKRVVDAWHAAEKVGRFVTVDGNVLKSDDGSEPMPSAVDDRLIIARRLVAERCIYGVDLNPLAVELAKLSIWLVTLSKGRPFGFLDHNLRHGDSLLGLHRLQSLTDFSLTSARNNHSVFSVNTAETVLEAMELRKRLRAIPIRDVRDVGNMARLDLEARMKLEGLELLADVMVGEALRSRGKEKGLNDALKYLSAFAKEVIDGDDETLQMFSRQAKEALAIDLPPGKLPRKPFHWVLDFPEVMTAGGFDAIVGNPPFMGGQKITGNLGTAYRDWLVHRLAGGQRGSADLCAYFFLRNASLLREGGTMGLLATNTIAQGDTREVGLQQLLDDGHVITRALPSTKWPGKANLEVAQVWSLRGEWDGAYKLDRKIVGGITSYLTTPDVVGGEPYRLKANEDKSFQGSIVLGLGFVLQPEEARTLIEKDPRNEEVLFPYLNGQDLNSRPDQSPSRWVINFFDWPLRREDMGESWGKADSKRRKEWLRDGIVPEDYPHSVAADYPDCLGVVEEKIKPEREKLPPKNAWNKKVAHFWWRFGAERVGLYSTIEKLNNQHGSCANVVCVAATSRSLAFSISEVDIVFSHMVYVLALPTYEGLALLQSSLHEFWARKESSTFRGDLRYTPVTCFETFPFPGTNNSFNVVGKHYYEYRQSIMQSTQKGLTATYNRFHDPNENHEEIKTLRDLHIAMDNAVAKSYGWDDLDLAHGFHETKQGARFTISEAARREVLQRLLKLNHERYEEEVRQGLHDKKKPSRK